jgi:hypothetical protein
MSPLMLRQTVCAEELLTLLALKYVIDTKLDPAI